MPSRTAAATFSFAVGAMPIPFALFALFAEYCGDWAMRTLRELLRAMLWIACAIGLLLWLLALPAFLLGYWIAAALLWLLLLPWRWLAAFDRPPYWAVLEGIVYIEPVGEREAIAREGGAIASRLALLREGLR